MRFWQRIIKTINNAIKLVLIEKMGTQIKDNPRNIANPEPNVAPLASPNVKLSARGLFKTV